MQLRGWQTAAAALAIDAVAPPHGNPSPSDMRMAEAIIKKHLEIANGDAGQAFQSILEQMFQSLGAETGAWCNLVPIPGQPLLPGTCAPGPLCFAQMDIPNGLITDCIRDIKGRRLKCICKKLDVSKFPWWWWVICAALIAAAWVAAGAHSGAAIAGFAWIHNMGYGETIGED
jgi:hypothetical protein